MVTKKALTNIIILLFCLFSYTANKGLFWIYYDFSKNLAKCEINGGDQVQSFAVDFSNGDISKIPFYFKIEVTSKDDSYAPVLCFSSRDMNCHPSDQIVKNDTGKTAVMWLKREEFFKYDQELYIYIECEKDKNDYSLIVSGEEYPIFGPNFVYSYLVGAYNREMKFVIQNNIKDVYMTISLDGSSKALLNIDNLDQEGFIYNNGSIFSFYIDNIEDESNMAIITIKGADIGEYLTLSCHLMNSIRIYDALAFPEVLIPNGPEITGLLEKKVIDIECFPLDLSQSKYKDMNKIYVTGKIHTKYAWFFLKDEKENFIEETDVDVSDGQLDFTITNNKKMIYICLELPIESIYSLDKMAFTISLTTK